MKLEHDDPWRCAIATSEIKIASRTARLVLSVSGMVRVADSARPFPAARGCWKQAIGASPRRPDSCAINSPAALSCHSNVFPSAAKVTGYLENRGVRSHFPSFVLYPPGRLENFSKENSSLEDELGTIVHASESSISFSTSSSAPSQSEISRLGKRPLQHSSTPTTVSRRLTTMTFSLHCMAYRGHELDVGKGG